jgi:thiamine biosynthesis protein ThiS
MNPPAKTAAPPDAITLTVNGAQRVFTGVHTLSDVLQRLELDPRMVVVELNRAIVRRPALAETAVHSGDALELVHFVGGG